MEQGLGNSGRIAIEVEIEKPFSGFLVFLFGIYVSSHQKTASCPSGNMTVMGHLGTTVTIPTCHPVAVLLWSLGWLALSWLSPPNAKILHKPPTWDSCVTPH